MLINNKLLARSRRGRTGASAPTVPLRRARQKIGRGDGAQSITRPRDTGDVLIQKIPDAGSHHSLHISGGYAAASTAPADISRIGFGRQSIHRSP